MYTIGQFSKIGKVSTKTLRYYDQINLLKPVQVDPENQYRYYSDQQVLIILLISELKEYGLKLEEIRAILDEQNAELLKEFLRNKIQEIDKEVEKNLKLRSSIELKLVKIESGGKLMETKDLKVELKEREPMIVISRRAATRIENISVLIGKVFEDIYQLNLQPSGPVMTVYYDKEFDAENADIEVCIPVNKNVNVESSDKLKEFKGGLTACTKFVGPYSRLGEAYAKVMKWIDDHGYKNFGAPYDIYLTDPRTTTNPDEFVTEVFFPVMK
ncbi:putative transcriptional regulator [Desulfosporosinus orientis DSM 765]|uniref:Putative transcriptional regulator n=1 Tax=Desulfosporosinus orientis (strain ATCC 19365 / DSM 765 / NCIMB 8382 / VKM B-1628 / Singapore I) TaxID=768706 RepID=G7WHR9_DESOD|nr:MerR family transcriptional regulator [Desulfosporosinus orientis]AET69631.1 putative transcriptional regulator [Desulfosporosinus orientis DSM 765]